ncbi:hypothetical protein BBO99_00004826 [Phytophthora kernoviae]|uniref:Phospholipid/glycerol acyltransferase domain-containing protein n=2 Tax=Phytophthora kernoviae TaxID=325452 RepID=A0A421ETE3_9STRA|nr:hypothetical protein G195_005652 [Phytophthora kernoviae 00238/432]KAG2522517.1 hypothetical protein JM18_004644 [Phytophthora kernoviae]KAG2524135.1 hypothetical protein JM16_002628 [Phytophthora kernoviae]RLM96945.1 hypothetical protein BBI17_005249 [Phytophthora kernoviae]RLN80018.1 hypothetical protein BBO99_00004826 [Phytophthora kernoviae]
MEKYSRWSDLSTGINPFVPQLFASEEAANSRRLGLVTAKGGHSTGSSRVGPGDVVVCNYTSFVEILYLARRFSPVFVFATEGKTDNGGLVHVCGLPEALYRSLAMPVSAERVKPTRKIADVVRRASGPIVILPEGARSNGKAVLRFIPLLENLPVKTRVHLVAFRYEFKHFSPSHSAGSGWLHLFWMAFHLYHTIRVTVLNARDLNLKELIPATMLRSKKQESSKTLTTVQVEKLRSLLAAMLRTKVVDLGPKDFVSFNAYWKHVNSGGRQPASQFTDRKAPHEHAQWAKR